MTYNFLNSPLSGVFAADADFISQNDVDLIIRHRFVITGKAVFFLRRFDKFGIAVVKAPSALFGRNRSSQSRSGWHALISVRFFHCESVFTI